MNFSIKSKNLMTLSIYLPEILEDGHSLPDPAAGQLTVGPRPALPHKETGYRKYNFSILGENPL